VPAISSSSPIHSMPALLPRRRSFPLRTLHRVPLPLSLPPTPPKTIRFYSSKAIDGLDPDVYGTDPIYYLVGEYDEAK